MFNYSILINFSFVLEWLLGSGTPFAAEDRTHDMGKLLFLYMLWSILLILQLQYQPCDTVHHNTQERQAIKVKCQIT